MQRCLFRQRVKDKQSPGADVMRKFENVGAAKPMRFAGGNCGVGKPHRFKERGKCENVKTCRPAGVRTPARLNRWAKLGKVNEPVFYFAALGALRCVWEPA